MKQPLPDRTDVLLAMSKRRLRTNIELHKQNTHLGPPLGFTYQSRANQAERMQAI